LAEGYSSPSQKARRITEGWFKRNMYCPSCVDERFEATPNSNPVVDFVCIGCGAEFQVKSKSGPLGRKLRDAAYGPMMQSIREGRTPHFAFILMNVKHYSRPATIKIPDSVRTSFASPKGRFLGAWPKNGFTRGPRNDDLGPFCVQVRASAAVFLAADIR
jgi:hypothetical protein